MTNLISRLRFSIAALLREGADALEGVGSRLPDLSRFNPDDNTRTDIG